MLAAAIVTLVRVWNGTRFDAMIPAIPGLPLAFMVYPVEAVLLVTVATVTFLVLLYSVGYMAEDRGKTRFCAEMSLFAASMQLLVISDDWLTLIAAWELIGLASYLLIGFWYERDGTGRAGARAFLMTRTVDLGLYIGAFILITQSGTSEIERSLNVGGWYAVVAGLLIIVAAMGKAAQVPFQGWLQDAMIGPTPVSALLHSATLVAAGAVLLIRTFALFTPGLLLMIGIVGGITAILAGLMGYAQSDLKRMLAASTSSQLGFMFLAVGSGFPAVALAHLVTHAAMKTSLFFGAGIFQRDRGSTEFGRIAGSGRVRARVALGFVLAGLALAGVPVLSGYWSKEAVESAAFNSPYVCPLGPLVLIGTLLTGAYVARSFRLLWYGGGRKGRLRGAIWMGTGLTVMVFFALTLGIAVEPIARLAGTKVLENDVARWLGLAATFSGLAIGWLLPAERVFGGLESWVRTGFRLAEGYSTLIIQPAMWIATALDKLDGRIHEKVVLGAGRTALMVAAATRVSDDRGIDSIIRELVSGAKGMGSRARAAQSGLVHRELVLAGVGTLLLIVLILIVK